MSATRNRLAFVDGLRAVAVLSVVAYHAAGHDPAIAAASPKFLVDALRQGCHGVDLFFVLSGFCLSYPFIAAVARGESVTFDTVRFAARRIVRIVPPYYAAILMLLAFCGVYALLRWPLPVGMPQGGFAASDVIRQALFFDSNVKLLNDVFWTLAIEFRWYFAFPVLLWLWFRSPRAFAALGIGVFCAATATRAQSLDLVVLPTFMSGIVAAHMFVHRPRSVVRIAPFACVALIIAAFATSQTAQFVWSASPYWSCAMFAFVVAAGSSPGVEAALSLRPLTAIGYTSYGIYLVHEPLRAFAMRLLSTGVSGWPLWLAAVVCAVCGGMIFSVFAELPFVHSPLRSALLAQIQPALARWFRLGGLSGELALSETDAQNLQVRSVA